MGHPRKSLLCMALAASLALAQSPGTAPPALNGETLDGQPISVPAASAGKVTLLLVAFTKTAGDNANPWRDRFERDFPNPRVTTYAVAMLEDAPAMLRGMIKAGMRGAVPPVRRSHFVVCVSNEQNWKKFTRMSDGKWPYLVLLDGSGQVRWNESGLFDETHYQALKATTAALLKR